MHIESSNYNRIVGWKKETEFNVEKTPPMWRRKNHGKTYLLCGVLYRVQGVLFIQAKEIEIGSHNLIQQISP
jgi:hypothetical protein